jgi:hypothetical protein
MTQQPLGQVSRSWTTRRDEKQRRMQQVQHWMEGPILPRTKMIEALESLIVSGGRVVLEGDNQKQADFLSRSLVQVDAKKVHDLHLIISSISRPEHLTLFELKEGGFRLCRCAEPARPTSNSMRDCWSIRFPMSFLFAPNRRMQRKVSEFGARETAIAGWLF